MRDVEYTYKILDEKSEEMKPHARLLRGLVEYSNIPIKADNYTVAGL
jgi:hypothetical protein